ncbi:MAG TPA: hypothetical protein VGE86_02070 [Thermoanaerobaculia bacterium]
MKLTLISMVLALLVALPCAAQERAANEPNEAAEESQKRDYTKEKLRSIFLEASEEAAEAHQDPFKTGIPLFSFEIGGSKTTVRFLPFSALIPGQTGLEMHPIINPFDMTGSPGTAMSGRTRNRYTEWWIRRKLGFPLTPPKERP